MLRVLRDSFVNRGTSLIKVLKTMCPLPSEDHSSSRTCPCNCLRASVSVEMSSASGWQQTSCHATARRSRAQPSGVPLTLQIVGLHVSSCVTFGNADQHLPTLIETLEVIHRALEDLSWPLVKGQKLLPVGSDGSPPQASFQTSVGSAPDTMLNSVSASRIRCRIHCRTLAT